jgi:predicted transposase/invertase (TIGR01784 family)
LYFFKHAEGSTFKEIEHLIGSDVIIRRAFEAIDQAAWTEEELNTYDKITKTRLDNQAVEQQKIEDAEARGKAEENTRVKNEIAKRMLSKNHSISDISDLIGLSPEEISKL